MTTGIVYKYFDLIDGFVRVKVVSPEEALPALQKGVGEPPSRREYRRLVVRSCVLAFEEEVLPRVHAVYPEDLIAAEDLLYQICVDVNPALEIHSVALPAEADAGLAASPEQEAHRMQRVESLEERLRADLVGQDAAVAQVCRAVRKSACGLNDPNRPVGAFLLVGRTGTGKTQLAKSLAQHLHGEHGLVRIDCSEFALPHETAKLIGAPPGYVGHNDGGTLTEALKRDPRCVVLFDEVEKGHEKLHNMLLQILDEGRLTDSKGETVSFKQAVVMLTSNVGTSDYAAARDRLGFGADQGLAVADYEDLTHVALRRDFKPELLNRLDGILVFRALDPADCERIAELQLEHLRERVRGAGVRLEWTPRLTRAVAEAGWSEEYGAREVKRSLARLVEEPLTDGVLSGDFRAGSRVRAGWRAGRLTLRIAE